MLEKMSGVFCFVLGGDGMRFVRNKKQIPEETKPKQILEEKLEKDIREKDSNIQQMLYTDTMLKYRLMLDTDDRINLKRHNFNAYMEDLALEMFTEYIASYMLLSSEQNKNFNAIKEQASQELFLRLRRLYNSL